MKTVNQVTLIGYINRPEPANEAERKPLKFCLVTKRAGYTKQDGTKVEDEPMFHNCVCFGKLGVTMSQYIQQGDLLYVDGEIVYNKYTDKNGVDKISTNVYVNNLSILSHKQNNVQQQPMQQQFASVAPQPGMMPQYQQQYTQQVQPQYQQPMQYQQPVQSNNPPF